MLRYMFLGMLLTAPLLVPPCGSASVAATEARGDPSLDGVENYVAPIYNVLRIKQGDVIEYLKGTAVIEVKLASDGSVQSASIVSAHLPLLGFWAKKAAYQWRFECSEEGRARVLNIRFVFEGVSTGENGGLKTWYENPLTLHIENVQPTILRLERIDGKVPPRLCEVHQVEMEVNLVPIRYGLVSGIDPDSPKFVTYEEYWEAKKRSFPNAHEWLRGGCNVRTEELAEIYSCPACQNEKELWLEHFPDFVPDS